MITRFSERALRRCLQWVAVFLAIGLPLGLFIGGAQPVAVDLVPPPWDKLVHTLVFAVLAAAIGYASRLRGSKMLAMAFCGAVAVGALDEWHQVYLPGRSAGWDDLAADAFGSGVGTALLHWCQRLKVWHLITHH